MKDIEKVIKVDDREYPIVFNLNVMEAIQEEYGTVQKWGELSEGKDGEPNAKAVIFGITQMINEGIDIRNEKNGTDVKPLTLKQAGRLISRIGVDVASKQLQDTVIESTQSNEKNA